jgi:predicted short-subunit dehydrogenase-like oxidoreductase (DUF2520 family)
MKKLPVGLVIEGSYTASTLLRLSNLAVELGPIKSSGLQVARRVSNFIKGGYGVNSYSDLASARTILIRVPDESIGRVVRELCQSELNFQDHSFVLCETWAATEKLKPLKALGAITASLVALPTSQNRTFVMEGDVAVVRQMRRLIERAGAHSVELKSGSKHLLFAATVLCSAIPVSLLVMAQQLLRDGGVSGNQLSAALEEMSIEMLNCFMKGARMTWGGALADLLKSTDGDYWDQLEVTHQGIAQDLKQLVEMGRTYGTPKIGRGQGA